MCAFFISAQTLCVVVVAMCTVVLAAPAPDVSHLPAAGFLEHTEVRDEAGQYALSFLTANGIAFTEQGALKPNQDGTGNVLVKQVQFGLIGMRESSH